jgi:hypothetical protein
MGGELLVGDLAGEHHAVVHGQPPGQPFQAPPVRAIAHHQEPRSWELGQDARHGPDDDVLSLAQGEPRHASDQRVVPEPVPVPHLGVGDAGVEQGRVDAGGQQLDRGPVSHHVPQAIDRPLRDAGQ